MSKLSPKYPPSNSVCSDLGLRLWLKNVSVSNGLSPKFCDLKTLKGVPSTEGANEGIYHNVGYLCLSDSERCFGFVLKVYCAPSLETFNKWEVRYTLHARSIVRTRPKNHWFSTVNGRSMKQPNGHSHDRYSRKVAFARTSIELPQTYCERRMCEQKRSFSSKTKMTHE